MACITCVVFMQRGKVDSMLDELYLTWGGPCDVFLLSPVGNCTADGFSAVDESDLGAWQVKIIFICPERMLGLHGNFPCLNEAIPEDTVHAV